MPSAGALICLASAVAFGAMAIFGKLAYDEGATVGTLLSVRFLIAAALFWALVAGHRSRTSSAHALTPRPRHRPRARRRAATARRPAPTSPPWSGWTHPCCPCSSTRSPRWSRSRRSRSAASGRTAAPPARSWSRRAACSSSWPGRGAGALDPLGTLLGVTAAVVYSTYILTSEGVAERVGPLVLSALVCTRRGDDADLAGATGGDMHPGDVTRRATGGSRASRSCPRSAPSACSSRAFAGSARRRPRSSRRPSR